MLGFGVKKDRITMRFPIINSSIICWKSLYMKSKIIFLFLLLPVFVEAQCWKDIASKSDHVLAIHVDGTLWQWGGNQLFYRGQKSPTLVNSDTTWKEIASGTGFYAAIKGDGTLWMWGDNSFGQLGIGNTTNNWNPVQVGTSTDWKDVSCGEGHTVAIKTNGSLWAWGRNNYGQLSTGLGRINSSVPVQVGTDTNWKEISAGRYHTLAKKTTNQLFFIGACYGTQFSQPNAVTAATDWADFSASAYVDYAIKQNGTLWKWVHTAASASGVTQVGTATNWSKVASSHGTSIEEHALLIQTNGTLWAIGKNQFGQLGDGTVIEKTLPIQIGTATDWLFVCAGLYTSFALKSNNSLWVWGMNQHTQFGNYKNKNVFQPVASPSSWKKASTPISSFSGHTLAIASNGTLWSWGQNNDGQLGIGTTYTHKVLPVQVGTSADWKQVTNGNFASLAIRENGTLWAWGRNTYGVLGTGTGTSNILTPFQVGTDTTWNQVSAGNEHVLAIKENGTLWAWGRNNQGQLGIGSTVDQVTPVQVGTETTWVWVSAGLQFSTALKSDGTLWTWGSNSHGQLGRVGVTNIPGLVNSSNPWKTVAAGGYHTVGIKQDSTLWAWGRNDYGQMGNNTSTNSSAPFLINSSPVWLKIGTGLEHSLAIKTDSTLWVWGRNTNGQTGDTIEYLTALPKTIVPKMIPSTSTWKEIDGGNINSIAITSNGEINTTGYGFVQDAQLFHSELGYTQLTPLPTNSCTFCPPSDTNLFVSICSGTSYLFNGNTLTTSGVYTQNLFSINGCDSTIFLNLTVNTPSTGADTIGACDSYTWPLNGTTYTSSGTYTHVGTNASGCPLTTTLNLTINNSTTATVSVTACDSYTWALNGTTYTNSGNYTHVGTNASGCTLTTTLNLTINNSSTATVTESACDSYTWALNGTTYTSSGNYTHIGTNASGCTLTTTLNLTINNSSTATVTESACDSYTLALNGTTYTNSGTYTHVGTNASGCPLTTTLNLTINNSTTASATETACDSYTWTLNGTSYTSSGAYTHIGTNASGCPLTTTLNLTINDLDVSTTLSGITITVNASDASYQWIDCNNGNVIIPGATAQSFTATVNGNYAVIASNANCTDTSVCQAINSVGIKEFNASFIEVYPNPTSGNVHILLGKVFPNTSIKLVNALGQAICQKTQTSAKEITFEIEGAPGVYFLEIETVEQVLGRIRVIKN
jgi:alpha-tubulin suppressor-like RCC1 family protein